VKEGKGGRSEFSAGPGRRPERALAFPVPLSRTTSSAPRALAHLLDADMKTPRNLGLVAVVVFAISHFLPVYGSSPGFACFGDCWSMLSGHHADILSGGWFYYSEFVISNIFFIGLVMAI
jgi:hypothetical protein